MPTNYQSVDVSVSGQKVVVTEIPNAIPTTPLAEVDSDTAADTILGVKDGAVVQLDPDELKDELGVSAVETELADKLETDANGDLTITGGLTAAYARINSLACKVFSGLPSWTGSSVSAPTSYSGYGRCIMFGYGETDKYFILIDSGGRLWAGRALNNATSVTWVEK